MGEEGGYGMSAIEIRAIDHLVLRVADLARSLHFYCDILGCREERRIAAMGLVQLRAGASLVDLLDVGEAREKSDEPNVEHFALQLTEFDEAAIRSHLDAAGVKPGKVMQLYGAEGTGPAMYIEDPDGNVVELKGPATSGPADP